MAHGALTGPVRADGDITQRRFRIVLFLGTLTSLISFLDRSVLNILAEPIKRDLGFSDTQLGLLTGFAFALFYSLIGLPIARYVDRPTTNRPMVIALCMALWSAATAISGGVAGYLQLFVARVMVAVGESGAGPAVITMINHYVSPQKRSRAFGIYSLGVPLGTLCGLALGGWLVDLVGWRLTFLVVGAPGLIVALLAWPFVYEPRKHEPQLEADRAAPPSVFDNFHVIWRTPALFWLCLAAATAGFFSVGVPSWVGVYMIRVHDLSPTHAGIALGLIMGIGGGLGTIFGGIFADKVAGGRQGRALLVPATAALIAMPAAAIAFLSRDWMVFTGFYLVAALCANAYFGPYFNLIQLLVTPVYRASTTIIAVMIANIIGAGLGPFLIGVASDMLAPEFGVESLRWVLIGAQLFAVLPAYLFWKTSRLAIEPAR